MTVDVLVLLAAVCIYVCDGKPGCDLKGFFAKAKTHILFSSLAVYFNPSLIIWLMQYTAYIATP